ncbi:BREX protein BrxB domain-containing protein [Paenibacillus taichungensis]|uniref:BREX protein BrxB domain-containing protein n=1 Tax=Paenibacillus taichungensis TaxID=484184 RepID=UPI00399F7F0E
MYKRLEQLEERINEEGFTIPKGIGSEIPHFVFDYPAEDELIVRTYVEGLLKRTTLNIKEINLFEFLISLFEDDLEELVAIAEEEGYTELSQAIQTVLEDQDLLVDAFIEEADGVELIFISGVGTVHPFIRSSHLLKKLSNHAFRTPILLFYPGYFSGVDLRLFNKFRHEDEYQITRIS